jgi:hypothetical protein
VSGSNVVTTYYKDGLSMVKRILGHPPFLRGYVLQVLEFVTFFRILMGEPVSKGCAEKPRPSLLIMLSHGRISFR